MIAFNRDKTKDKNVPFKLAPETHEILIQIKDRTKRTYNDIFFDMGTEYLKAVKEALNEKPAKSKK